MALINARWRCQICGVRGWSLQAHHRAYPARGSEGPCDIIVACGKCHKDVHGIKETRLSKIKVETGMSSIDRPITHDPVTKGFKPSKLFLEIIAHNAWRETGGWDIDYDDILPLG